MKTVTRRILILATVSLLIILYFVLGIGDYVSFEQLKAHRQLLLNYVNQYYAISAALFMLVYILVTGLSLPGAAVMSLTSGFLFGTLLGALYVNIGATVGATIAFLLTRYVLGDAMQKKYGNKLARFNENLKKYGAYYLLTLRLIMIAPFFLINIIAGLTIVPLRTFVWTTALGIIPGSFVYTYAGQSLSSINSVNDIINYKVIIAGVLLALVAIIPAIIKASRKSVSLEVRKR